MLLSILVVDMAEASETEGSNLLWIKQSFVSEQADAPSASACWSALEGVH